MDAQNQGISFFPPPLLILFKETRTIMKKKLIEIKPKFKAVLEQQRSKIQLQFQELRKEIEICINYIDLNNVNLYVNHTKTVYGQLTELNETAKSLNFQENFLNYDCSDFKSTSPLRSYNIYHFPSVLFPFPYFYLFLSHIILLIISI